jgi:hypothetical protein
MSKEVRKIIDKAMTSLGLEYSFMEYAGNPVVYPYCVGEVTETEGVTEDGLQESTFLLTGFSRGTWLELEEDREKIENYFNRISGLTAITDSGSGVAIFYANSLVVPTGDAELKKVQINLSVKEWKVN